MAERVGVEDGLSPVSYTHLDVYKRQAERNAMRCPWADLGNDPSEFTAERIGGRSIVFTTTNGTQEMCIRDSRYSESSATGDVCYNVSDASRPVSYTHLLFIMQDSFQKVQLSIIEHTEIDLSMRQLHF